MYNGGTDLMNNQNNFLTNISVLYRYTQKYFDKNLSQYNLGSGQMIFLLLIYENEGISMQQLTLMGDFDKGTTTKSVQKLVEEGYVSMATDEADKRVKRLYTTKKTSEIINGIYGIRNEYANQLTKNIAADKAEEVMSYINQMTVNARDTMPEDNYQSLKLGGIQKLTLLDFPGKVACTLFTAGCNMKCPFCHNRDLVYIPENFNYFDPEEILEFLKKRQGILDGVAITGGEPLLQAGLLDFIEKIKEFGLQVKIDTNGSHPDKLKEAVESGLVDYVAMDVKNCFEKYPETIGQSTADFKINQIRKSIKYLLSDVVDYEFRTTVVREFHTKEDLLALARQIKGAKRYYLQSFVDSGRCIQQGLTAYSKEELEEFTESIRKIIPNTELR